MAIFSTYQIKFYQTKRKEEEMMSPMIPITDTIYNKTPRMKSTPPEVPEMTLADSLDRLKHDPNMIHFTVMKSVVSNRRWNGMEAHEAIAYLRGYLSTGSGEKRVWALDILLTFDNEESWHVVAEEALKNSNDEVRAMCQKEFDVYIKGGSDG